MIEEINNNGISRLAFNQPTIVPSFLTEKQSFQDSRRLDSNNSNNSSHLELSKINAEDLFEISILRDMPEIDESSEDSMDQNLRN